MAYEKQVWQSNELITADKLNHIEDGIAEAVNPDIVNNLTETTIGKVLDATQGKALKDMVEGLSAEDVDAIKDDYSYDAAAYPYTGQELILLHNVTTGENTVTDVASFLSSAGGGSGTNQGALVHYTKTISVSAGSTAQTFQDDNITADMVVLQAVITNPAAQGDDWNFTTSNGSVVLNGAVTEATTVTLYFGVSLSAAPSIQVNLASTTADNILKTNPTPGVMGTLGRSNGGTGVSASDTADLLSKLGAVNKAGDTMTGTLTISNSNSPGGSVRLWEDAEGGNIAILSKNGYEYQIDSFEDSSIRLYGPDDNGSLKFCRFNRTTGALSADGGFNGNATNVTGTVAVDHGGTGATTAAEARNNLGIKHATYTQNFTAANTGAYTDVDFGKSVYVLSASCVATRGYGIQCYARVSGLTKWTFILNRTDAITNVSFDVDYIEV